MSNRKSSSKDSNGLGCALFLMCIIFAMPIVGIYLVCKGNTDGDKAVGVMLIIIGIILWIYIANHI